MPLDLAARIKKYNEGRIPKMLQRKYVGMAENPFRFYRGTCHLFYEDIAPTLFINQSPATWICGDLHLENFGSFKGDNGVEYFDINDFDEAILAPCLWDVARLLVSVILAADISLKTNEAAAHELCRSFLTKYIQTLQIGQIGMVESRTSKGLVKDFMLSVGKRKRIDLVSKRTVLKNGKRKLIIDEEKASEVSADRKEQVMFIMEKWANSQKNKQKESDFYKVLDVGYRIAGTGSLGLERYVLLVKGKGSPDGNFLLDLKVAQQSAIEPYLKNIQQPSWHSEAQRVIEIQKRMQVAPPALLTVMELDGKSYLLKQLQPSQDKMNLQLCGGKLMKLDQVLNYFSQIVAFDQLRSGGRQGSAIADELIEFANQHQTWEKDLLAYVMMYADKVKKDYFLYKQAFDDGYYHSDLTGL
jgi:uncharacterized protein (DUF2252 family)